MRAFSRLCYGFRAWRVPSKCMAAAVPGRRRTAVESQTTTRLFTRVFEVGGRGSFLQFLRERAIERRDTLCRVLKVACEQWWSVAASAGSSSMSASTTLCNRFCGSVSVWVAFLAFSATRNPSWELGPALAGLFRASVFLCCATNAAAWRCQSGLADIPPAWRDGKSEEA